MGPTPDRAPVLGAADAPADRFGGVRYGVGVGARRRDGRAVHAALAGGVTELKRARASAGATSTTSAWLVLHGRRSECETLEQLVANVRGGLSQVLVLRGDAGIGKSALLQYLSRRASGCRVVRAAGVESEMKLAFAGLQQLCAPFLDRLDRLPAPQRDALGTAFGLREGNAPDRFLTGLAVLSLLRDVAEEQPLICLIDDGQWLDEASASTLAFVARRLLAESVALVFATRADGDDHPLRQLPGLRVPALRDADARALLRAALRGPLDAAVLDVIVAEARGNPLALLALPRGRTPAQLMFGFARPNTMPLVNPVEQRFLEQLELLPPETGLLLLTAAVEPAGDMTVIRRALERLRIGPEAAAPAEAAGLLEFGARVRFRHPLMRSAVWRAADPRDLRKVHGALAEVTGLDPDRRAWHRAQACSGPAEDIAADLERSVDRAQARGGFAAVGTFLERAAELTPDPMRRVARVLAAAQAKLQAGEFGPAADLLATIEPDSLDDLGRAGLDLLGAKIAFASGLGNQASPQLLATARRLEPLDLELARETYLDAFTATMLLGRLAGGTGLREVAEAVPRSPGKPPRKGDLLLDGLVSRYTDGYRTAMPVAKRALRAFCSEDISLAEGLRLLGPAATIAADVWDDESWSLLSGRHVRIAREAGALSDLLFALNNRVVMLTFAGDLALAATLVEEARSVREITGSNRASCGALVLAGWQGREAQARDLIEATLSQVAVRRGEGVVATVAQWASAVLFNGLGQYENALVAARRAVKDTDGPAVPNWGWTELIEAAVRGGVTELAADALERLSARTRASGTDWALGVESRCRALLSEDDDVAERLYREAIERLDRTRARVDSARTHLLYGEWLRRKRRRIDAREHLRTAHELFTAMGAEGFGERARRELVATGETARKRIVETRHELTAQEVQIAVLAAEGRTNSEIGAQLFISSRTVEWHLGKIFAKLAISSRRELRHALPDVVRATRPDDRGARF
jgi:DNA-binding CsgD family transcriptional regulator/tetratricopeptide (TPR) repeat protein